MPLIFFPEMWALTYVLVILEVISVYLFFNFISHLSVHPNAPDSLPQQSIKHDKINAIINRIKVKH